MLSRISSRSRSVRNVAVPLRTLTGRVSAWKPLPKLPAIRRPRGENYTGPKTRRIQRWLLEQKTVTGVLNTYDRHRFHASRANACIAFYNVAALAKTPADVEKAWADARLGPLLNDLELGAENYTMKELAKLIPAFRVIGTKHKQPLFEKLKARAAELVKLPRFDNTDKNALLLVLTAEEDYAKQASNSSDSPQTEAQRLTRPAHAPRQLNVARLRALPRPKPQPWPTEPAEAVKRYEVEKLARFDFSRRL